MSSHLCVHCGHTCYSYIGGDFTLIDDLMVMVFGGHGTQFCLFVCLSFDMILFNHLNIVKVKKIFYRSLWIDM